MTGTKFFLKIILETVKKGNTESHEQVLSHKFAGLFPNMAVITLITAR